MVFQITFTRIATILAQQLLYGLTCPLSVTRFHGTTAIQVIQSFSTSIAVTGVIMFEDRMRPQLQAHGAIFKLVSFKGVVILEAFQSFIFPVLAETGVFTPSPPYYVAWDDFDRGFPQFILVWEMIIVAIVFLRSFSFLPYLLEVRQGVPVSATAGSALLYSFNPIDIIRGVRYSFTPWSIQGEDIERDRFGSNPSNDKTAPETEFKASNSP